MNGWESVEYLSCGVSLHLKTKEEEMEEDKKAHHTSCLHTPTVYDWETHENSVWATDAGEAAKGET